MHHFKRAVIFDLDGVITDTQKIKTQVSIDLLYDRYGVELTPEEYEDRYAGMKTKHIFNSIFKKFEIEDNVDDFIEYRVGELNAQVEDFIPMVPGSVELLDKFKQLGFGIGLASGGSREWVDKIIKKLNIKNKFDVISYSDEVERSKPDPEIYLLAAEKIRVDPKHCLVIEDSKNGMRSAKDAGMMCICVVENMEEKNLPADVLVHDLRDIKPEEIDL